MADMRSCVKTGCRWPAAATLSYRYVTAEVWVTDLGDPHPATHDLCPHHADAMRVPRGWVLIDTRVPVEAPHEPSAAEIAERATSLRRSVTTILAEASPPPARQPSRYDALLADLPSYEPEDADAPSEDHVEGTGGRPGAAGAHSRAVARREELVSVTAAHELAPVIREIAAELAGPVVGTIQIDLTEEEVDGEADEAVDGAADEAVAGEADEAVDEDTGGADGLGDAKVVQLPLRMHGDSSVE